ncbi:MAG: hypothetical protein WCI34_08375, partial [Actinomycetes bacterium]
MPQSGSQLLAVGPWLPEAVHASWTADPYIPTEEATAAADVELQGLKDRGSPSHDGLAARLVAWEQTPDG